MAPLFSEDGRVASPQINRKELLKQLERIITSTHFRNSKRYPSFLRFIVERTVEDNTEVLKERNLGTEVFGRPSDYDTSADPIVRVTAGEVRKRIAQYYQTAGHEDELRIDLPLGSYVPHFHPGNHTPKTADREIVDDTPQHSEVAGDATSDEEDVILAPVANSPARSRRRLSVPKLFNIGLYAFAALGILAGSFFLASRIQSRVNNSGTNYFWQSYTSGSPDALIVIGVHFIDVNGKTIPADSHANSLHGANESALAAMESADMVPVSDIISYSKLTDLLTRRSLFYRTKSSVDTSLEELRPGPVILLGGFNNLWTMRLASALRFRFVAKGPNVNAIEDSRNPSINWVYDNLQPARDNSTDYAIVASYFDTTLEQHVLIAAGIGMSGTISATEFLSTEKYMKNWLNEVKLPPNKNVELVLSTQILDGEPGPPHVIAYEAW